MRNVYFNMDYVQKALKIVEESHELRDAANDVRKVKEARSQIHHSIFNITNGYTMQLRLQYARALDDEMRQKYPVINAMLDFSNCLPRRQSTGMAPTSVTECEEYWHLDQDYYGILLHVLMKKQITNSIEEYVKFVD